MNIVYVGNFKHPWCTEVHIAADLERLGHWVVREQEPAQHDPEFLAKLDTTCAAYDVRLLLYTRTWGKLGPDATALWRKLERCGTTTASYHLDLYVGLQRAASIDADPFWTTQHVFTPDGDPTSEAFFAAAGINHHWSPPAVVSDACVPGNYDPRFDYDVVFVGSESYHPEWPWRPALIDGLRKRYGDRFRRFGGDLPGGPVREQALNDLYASAQVVVGDTLALPGHTHYWSDRYPETMGRGGFLLAPWVEGMTYKAEVEFGRYNTGDIDDVCKRVDSWLDDPIARALIAWNGQDRVRDEDTYRHRLSVALDTMGLT